MMRKKSVILLFLSAILILSGCSKTESNEKIITEEKNLTKTGSLELKYATQFSVDFYEGDYAHIYLPDGTDYVLVPENGEDNSLGLESPVYIHRPCNIYLAASSAMDLLLQLDELGSVSACSTQANDYSMEEVKDAINNGAIVYVGKYSSPDYETLLGLGCNLAVESTMIGHSPKIKEQIERLGIPVFVERSSYENNPIGRLEWIKLYGLMTGKLDEASRYVDGELEKLTLRLKENKPADTVKTVAFFSISSNGYVTVRKPGDYVCKMIEMAGGQYALNGLTAENDNSLSTMNIGMEDFYREAKDADILIYNGTIDGGVVTLDELFEKSELLKDFKAVQNGCVYSTSLNMFQRSSKIIEIICEISELITSEDGLKSNCEYLIHLN